MEPLRAVPGVLGSLQVQERQGGGKREADAFRRALGEDRGGDGSGRSAGEQQPRSRPPGLQRGAAVSRKDDGKALHVDVLA
jgi:hypothetical protein